MKADFNEWLIKKYKALPDEVPDGTVNEFAEEYAKERLAEELKDFAINFDLERYIPDLGYHPDMQNAIEQYIKENLKDEHSS